MNIPDEVIDPAYAAWRDDPILHEGRATEPSLYEAFIAGAEWARKEALREAAEAVRRNAGDEDENGISEGVNNWPDAAARTYSFATHEAIEAIRALAEGVSDGQQ